MIDKAFDKGYVTFSDDYKLILSKKIECDRELYNTLIKYEGKKLSVKKKYAPEKRCLKWHREHVFKG